VRPRVYRFPDTRNWGDVFTSFLLREWLGLDFDETENASDADVFACGSLVERVPDGFTGHVLGCGAGYASTRRNLQNIQGPGLLRGALTAKRCGYNFIRLGDPGLLASRFATPGLKRSYGLGVIPHTVDKNNGELAYFADALGALLIDIEAGVREVIDAIAQCQRVVSSSLHGLVIADSLGVPSAWWQPQPSKLLGDGFKFYDYYSAYGELASPSRTIEDAVCQTRDVEKNRHDVSEVFQEFAYVMANGPLAKTEATV
jgi:pyruvyltransferase